MEWLLVILFLGINVMNASLSEYYLSGAGLFNATNSFLEKAFVALPMAYILVLGILIPTRHSICKYYNTQGIEVAAPEYNDGKLYIVVKRYSTGKTDTTKLLNR